MNFYRFGEMNYFIEKKIEAYEINNQLLEKSFLFSTFVVKLSFIICHEKNLYHFFIISILFTIFP